MALVKSSIGYFQGHLFDRPQFNFLPFKIRQIHIKSYTLVPNRSRMFFSERMACLFNFSFMLFHVLYWIKQSTRE